MQQMQALSTPPPVSRAGSLPSSMPRSCARNATARRIAAAAAGGGRPAEQPSAFSASAAGARSASPSASRTSSPHTVPTTAVSSARYASRSIIILTINSPNLSHQFGILKLRKVPPRILKTCWKFTGNMPASDGHQENLSTAGDIMDHKSTCDHTVPGSHSTSYTELRNVQHVNTFINR